MRQIIGSTADWAANNLVLGSGEIGIEVVTSSDIRLKVGDGTNTFSVLPYASSSSTSINTATQTALDAKLALAGGTMSGLVVLSGDPTVNLGAATKQYVDSINSTLTTSVSGKLPTAGGTMTGALTLSGAPSSSLHATTKTYVDTANALNVVKSGDTMSGFLTLSADPTSALHAATMNYVDTGAYQTAVGGSSTYAGKVVKLNAAGVLDSSMLTTSATYLGTVNLTVTYALSGSYTAGNYYALSLTGTIDASWSTHLNGSPSTCSAGQSIIYNSGTSKWDLVGDTTSSTAITGKLDKAGGTMTGALVLSGAPTIGLHAATKTYADTMVPLAGCTMSGLLTLSANPSAALGAATKQYVDAADATVTAAYIAADTALNGTITTSLAGKLSLTGGTMSGFVTLSADPTSGLHAATKTYTDTKAPLASPTFTGTPAAPSASRYTTTTQIATTAQVYDTVTNVPENAQTGTTYTFVSGDRGKMVSFSNAATITVTIPASTFTANDRVDLFQYGVGQVSLVAGAGLTIRSSGGKLKLTGQYSGGTVWFKSTTEAILIGDIAA